VLELAQQTGISIQLLQSSAIALRLVVKQEGGRLQTFVAQLSEHFTVQATEGVSLHTHLNAPIGGTTVPANALLFQADAQRVCYVLPS
jgi:hypothetical protein